PRRCPALASSIWCEYSVENQHIGLSSHLGNEAGLRVCGNDRMARLGFGISGLCPRWERGCRGGSADLVPTSWPLRSESALGSVVPLALSPSQTQGQSITRGSLNQGGLPWRR